jgi:hypothetical protein
MKKAPIVVLLLCQRLAAQSHQLDFTTGYNYQNSDQGQDVRANLNGWFASLQFDLSDLLSINGEVDNYYGSIQEASAKQQNFVVGPQLTFGPEKAKLRPFVYVEAGDQRSSSSGSVDHSFDLQTGAGVQVKLTERLALQFVPAEHDFGNAQ